MRVRRSAPNYATAPLICTFAQKSSAVLSPSPWLAQSKPDLLLKGFLKKSSRFLLRPREVKGKVFPYSLPSVGPGADPGVQAVSPQVT